MRVHMRVHMQDGNYCYFYNVFARQPLMQGDCSVDFLQLHTFIMYRTVASVADLGEGVRGEVIKYALTAQLSAYNIVS